MKRIPVLLVLLILSVSSYAQLSQQKKATIDSFLTSLNNHNKFMGSLTIYKNGEVLYDNQIGEVELKKETWKATSKTKYRIGSITKMFTSIMILQLVDEGKLSLDTRLSNYYPTIPNADKITIRQMLNHHSGIYSVTDDDHYMQWSTKPITKKAMINRIVKAQPSFNPGEKGEYSNSNFILLGYIIEEIEKKPYTEVLKQRITEKLSLTSTDFGTSHQQDENEGLSFIINKAGEWEVFQETDMSVPQGAGAMVSTTKEMSVFMDGLFKGKLLPKQWLDTMTTMNGRYGMGIFEFPLYEMKTYGHTGGIDAFSSMLTYNINDSTVIAFSANGLNYDMNMIVLSVANIIYDKGFEMPDFTSIKLTKEEAKKYEGEYESKELPISIGVFYEAGRLKAQGKGQSAFMLNMKEDGTFEFPAAGIKMSFKDEEDGKYQTMMFTQAGRTYTYKRK